MNKIKRMMCKHKNKQSRWTYPEQWTYNEFFDLAQTIRYKEIYCEDCDKSFGTVLAQPIFNSSIYDEVKEEYLKNNDIKAMKSSF